MTLIVPERMLRFINSKGLPTNDLTALQLLVTDILNFLPINLFPGNCQVLTFDQYREPIDATARRHELFRPIKVYEWIAPGKAHFFLKTSLRRRPIILDPAGVYDRENTKEILPYFGLQQHAPDFARTFYDAGRPLRSKA